MVYLSAQTHRALLIIFKEITTIEIIALIWLCIGNKQRAMERGNSGRAAITYTLILWLVPEILVGALLWYFFGISVITYILALFFGVIGGIISMYISIKGVRQIASLPVAAKLAAPCTVRLYRDDSDIEHKQTRYFSLNNVYIGSLDNDTVLEFEATKSQNLLTARSGYEASNETSYTFEAQSGGTMQIHIAGGVFQEDKTKVYDEDELPTNTKDTQ